jgi:hypothetical protein
LAGELHLADAQSPAAALFAQPTEVKARQLPQRIQTQTAWHHRIADKVTFEEPKVGVHVQLG